MTNNKRLKKVLITLCTAICLVLIGGIVYKLVQINKKPPVIEEPPKQQIVVGEEYTSESDIFKQELPKYLNSIKDIKSGFSWKLNNDEYSSYSFFNDILYYENRKNGIENYYNKEGDKILFTYKSGSSYTKLYFDGDDPFGVLNFNIDDINWLSLEMLNNDEVKINGVNEQNQEVSLTFNVKELESDTKKIAFKIDDKSGYVNISPNIEVELPKNVWQDYTKVDFIGFKTKFDEFVKSLECNNYSVLRNILSLSEGSSSKIKLLKFDENNVQYINNYDKSKKEIMFYVKNDSDDAIEFSIFNNKWSKGYNNYFYNIYVQDVKDALEILKTLDFSVYSYDFDYQFWRYNTPNRIQGSVQFTDEGLKFTYDNPKEEQDENEFTIFDVGKTSVELPKYYYDRETRQWVDNRTEEEKKEDEKQQGNENANEIKNANFLRRISEAVCK